MFKLMDKEKMAILSKFIWLTGPMLKSHVQVHIAFVLEYFQGCPILDSHGIIILIFQESGKRELSLSNVAGIFYILIAGLVFAIVLASAEFLFKKSKLIEKVCYLGNG